MKLDPCTHRPPCPGCPRYGESGIAASRLAVLEEVALAGGAELDRVVEGKRTGFRGRARLAVRGRAASPKLGIFQQGSHRIADIPSCIVHHPAVNQTARLLRHAIRETGIAPYADAPHKGLLRYVQLVVERGSGRVQVVLVVNDVSPASMAPLADALVGKMGGSLQGLWWNGNAVRGNAILGEHWQLLAGEEALSETIGGARVFFPPGAFGQSNLDLADRIVADIHSRVPDDELVAELYCGVGAIGLGLLRRVRELRFNEVSPHSLLGLGMGLAALAADERERATVAGGEAASCLDVLGGATTVIVDPPRKGLEAAVLTRLREEAPARLLYLSCDADSLGRDAALLTSSGTLRLRRLTPYALFPFTDHVETLAEFSAA